jgi:hypothetical protein
MKRCSISENKYRKSYEEIGILVCCSGNTKWYSHYGKQYGMSLKNFKKWNCHMIQLTCFRVFLQEN